MVTPEELAETVAWEFDNLALADIPDAWERFGSALQRAYTASTEAFRHSAAAQECLDGIDWELGVTIGRSPREQA